MKKEYSYPDFNLQLINNLDIMTASDEQQETGPHENTYEDISGVFNWNL